MADKKNSKRKSVAKSQFMHLYGAKLRSEILSTVSKSNASSQPERRVSVASAIEVANRSLAKTATYSSDVRYFSAIRSVNSFLALATRNKQTPQALSNVDLLPIGHPASTRAHAMTASALRHAQARWVAADPMIDDSVRALVASAHAARPGSTERAHAFARLSIAGLGKVPSYAAIDELSIDPIVAAFGLGLGGNSSAARRLRAQMQRRDRRGRFAFMGGGWSFNLRLPDGMFKAVSGRVVGQSGDDGVEIEVVGSKHLPNGVYTMPASKGESVAAILSEEAVKDLPDVDVYVGTDDVYMDSADLVSSRMDAPSGWTRNVTSTDGTGKNARSISWENQETAYTVDEDLSASGERTGKLVLRQGLDGSLVARASNWGDVQKEIDADQPEYVKKLQAAEATRAEKEAADAAKAAEKAKVQSGEVPPYNLPAGSEWIKGPKGQWVPFDTKADYDVSDEELAKRAENAAKADMGKPPKMFPKGFDEPTEAFKAWRNRVTKKAKELLENYKIARDHQRSLKGEPSAATESFDFPLAVPSAHEDINQYVPSAQMVDTGRKDKDGLPIIRITVASKDLNKLAGWADADSVEQLRADYASGEPSASKKPSVDEIQSAIDAGEEISFVYNGKKRTLTPEGLWENPKTGVTNVYGMDKDAGEKRTYTIEKMDAVPEAAPKAKLAPTEVKPIKDGDIESMKAQVQSAIDAGESIAFDYNDKPRVFTPERIYFNPKNGNTNVAGFSQTDGEDRTFAIDNMSPPSGPIKPPTAEPAADLPPTPQKRFTNSGRQDLWDSIEAHQRSLMEKQPAPGAPTGGPGEPPTGGPGGPSMSPNDVYFDRQNSSYVDENGRSFSAEELESRGLDSSRRTTPEADIPDLPKKKSKVRKWKKGTDERWVNEDDKDQQDFLRSQGFKGDPPSKTQTWLDIDKEKLEELKAERNVPVEAPAEEVPAVEAAEPTADRKKVVQEIEDALAYREELRERNFIIDFEARTTEDPGDFDWNPDSDFSKQLVDEGLGKYLDFEENPRYGVDDDESRWDVSLDTDSMSDGEINTLADILNGDLPPEDRIPKVPGPGGKGPTPLSNADVPELRSQIDDAINNGDTITFTYNGKERTVRPQRTYFNPKNGSTNLVGFSEGDGEDRTFSLDKIEFPQAAPEEMVDPNQAFFEEEFDSMFDTPNGAYKPKIYEIYEPKGRQGQASAEYTDDPEMLATRFEDTALAEALRDAVLPSSDGDQASGQGSLPFTSGDELIPAEALYEALQYSGIDADTILAGIYDSVLDPNRPETNVDRVNQRADEMFLEPSSSPLRNELPATNRSEEILRAKSTSSEIGKVFRTEALKDTLRDYEETNPVLEKVADAISDASTDGMDLESMFKYLYPLANGSEDDKQAFRGFWGMLMSLDGGDSPEDIDASMDLGGEDAGYRNRLLDQLAEMFDGDVDLAKEMYNELIDNYGGYPEFVQSRESIINGTADLDSKTTGAAFYRMAMSASTPNKAPLYRVINVANDDALVDVYTTEGSSFYLDPRSWTSTNIADGSLASQFFGPSDTSGARIIFEALPGDIDSFDASTISPFPGENEHFAHGELEVVSVRRNKMRLTGGEEIVVQVRKAPQAPEAPEAQAAPEAGAPPSGGWPPKTKTYTGIEGWTKTGGGTGSNPGGFYRDQDGNEYYVKIPKSQSHADNETLAALLYEALGVPAAETSYGDENGDLRLVSPIVPGSDPMGFFDHYEADDPEYLDQIRDHFVIDAWLANYDVIGFLHDGSTNIISDGNGNPIRVDPGASLMWRAQGKPKGDDRFSYDDRDLDSMRDHDINPQAASVFASTTDAQLRDAAMRLRDLTPSMIDQIVDANVASESDRKVLKDKLKARRRAILDRFNIPEGIDDPEMFPDPVPLTESMGYAAQDLLPGDVTASDSFVIDKVFQDENTPSGKVSVQGYYPGHEMQRKEWNAGTVIEVSRGGTQPPMGDQPALHRPEKPRKPSSGAFTGRMQELLSGVDTWEEAAAVIRGTEIVYFDYETTGLSTTPGDGELNRPVQLGAVKVKDGKVIERMNVYMNPEFRLSEWSRDNLKQENGDAVTDEWLQTQPSMLEAHQQFLDFAGESPILGGQYVPFDLEVLQRTLAEQGLELDIAGTIDSKDIAAGSLPKWSAKSPEGPVQIGKDGKRRASNSLGPVAEYLGVELNNWHRADADAEASANIVDAMLERAVSNPDTPKNLLDTDGSFEAQRLRQAEYEAASAQYKQDLAEYEMSKAIAAAWNCGGSGITASVGENGPCSIPSIDKLIEAASPDGTDSVDPDGVALGDPANPSSMADAFDVDSAEHDGKSVRDPYAGEAFPPTPQQREVVDAVLTGEDVKVLALAGTGKTSTLKLIARRLGREQPKKRIIYVAFNKSIQTEADATMPDNVESRTADSISYRAMPKEITSKIGSKSALVKAKDIGSHFGIYGHVVTNMDGEQEELSQFETIRALQKAITKYTNSADDVIGAQHFEDFEADDRMLDWANAIWADINSPKGVIRLTNSHITKMWALTRPDLSKDGSGLSRPADIIFFDEAQDINPVLGKVIADQTIQKIYVGDSNQAIYGFRGAVDQLEQVDAQHELPLTKSWRFGPQVAGIGNRFLTLIGAKQRIEGAGPDGVIVERGTMTDAQAVLVRTNIGAIKEISTELNNGRSVGVSKNFKDDLDSLSRSANWLKNGGPKPSKIHEEIAPFSSWAELEKAIADEETSQKLGTFLELIDEVGFDGLDEMLSRLKIYKSSEDGLGASPSAAALPELTIYSARSGSKGTIVEGVEYTIIGDMIALNGKKLFDNKEVAKKNGFKWDAERKRWAKSISSDNGRLSTLTKLRDGMGGGSQEDDRIDVVITTAHRAKGLEWDKVRIGDDFWGPRVNKDTGDKTMPAPEELKLDYVAVTRAKKELDPGGLDWVYAETSDEDESPNMPEISAPEENIPPPPGAPEAPQADEIPPPPPSPEADAGDIIPPPPPGSDKTAVGAPEPEPEDGLSGTPETPDAFDPLDETPPYTGPVQDVNVINDEASVAQATYEGFDKDYADAVDALDADLVFLREEGNAKEKKAAKELQKAKDVIDRFNNGEISRAEAIEQLKTLEDEALERAKKSSGAEERVLNEQVNGDIAEVRRVLDATASTGILVSKHYPPEGSGKGFDKNGVFIKIGDRVRDKWGYAGTVTRYNSSGGWNNIYIKKDIDHRDPSKVDPKKWGPGYIDSKGTGSVTVIKEGEDNSPYVPVPGKESKGPQKLDEQLAKLQSNKDSGDKGDDGLGVRPFMGPEDDDSGGAAGEPAAGTTEALRENVEARSEADAWSGEEESRTDTPKAEAPTGATTEVPEDLNDEIGAGEPKSGPPATISEDVKEVSDKVSKEWEAAGWSPATISKAEKATGKYQKEYPGSKIYTDSRGGQLWFSVKKGKLGERRVFVHSVFVDEKARRQGIAADLLDKLANDYFGLQISPGGLTKDGKPFWNWWADSRGLAELTDPEFPNSRHLMTDKQLSARSAGEKVDGSNFPYDTISKTEPETPSAPEVDNSPEVTTKLGTDISAPDVTQPDTKAAPDHTPQDYELIKKMIAEGPQAIGSEMTANWVKHIEEFRAKRDVDPDAEDDDAERGIDFVEKYDRSRRDELRDDTEGDAFLQNLLLGISMFVETGPQRADKEWYNDSFIRGEEKTLTDLIDPSRESVRSFYTDIARYYENPDLIDQELTPASAFLRAVRSARKKDGEFARVLSFDKKISDPEHPLHKLLTVGQEIDLRPSSWTVGDNVGNLEAIVDKYHDALESDPVKRQKILDNTTNIILSVNGADAFDISKYGIREERESVLTNGRYRVTNVERVEVPLNSEMFHDDMYMAAVKISIEQIESPSAEEADAPEVAETDAGGGGGELPPTDEKITDTPEPEPNDDLSAAFQKQDTELKNKTEKAKEARRLKNAPLSDLIAKILNSDFYESPDNPDKYKRIKSIGKNLGPASSIADHPIATLELPDLKILASYIDGYKKEKGSLTSDEQKILDEVNKAIEYASAPNARRGGNDRPLAMDLITADEFVDSVFDMGWIYPDGRIYPVRMAHENEHDYDESYEDGLIRLTGNREKLWGSKNKIKQIPGSISIENRDKAPNSDQAQTIETLLNKIPHGTLFIANSDNPDGRLVSPEEEKTDGVSGIFGVEDTEPEVVEDAEPEVVEDTTSKALPEPVKDEDGTWVGEIPYEELQKMKRTGSHPDKLPFFMQMGADPGDGYFWTRRGNRFWGRYGAAGTLVRYRDPETGEYRYLLGKRAAWISAGGGKWGIPGGAHKDLDANEEPTITAFAELKEELGIDLGDTSDDPDDGPGVVSEFHFSDLDPEWSYDTFIVDVPKSLATSASISDSETSEIGFFTLDELKKMADNDELHPAFAASIDEIIDLARDSETESRAEEAVNFDTSNIENIPSINSTLDTLRGSAMPRADVLVDGDDIEDTRVTFTKEIGDKHSGLVARFKLTSWAGDRARSERKDSDSWESRSGENEIAFEKKALSKRTGEVLIDPSGKRGEEPLPTPGIDNDPMHAEFGTRHVYIDPEGRFTIDVYESDKDNLVEVGFNYQVPAWNAVDNKVEIKFADDNPSEEVMKEAFKIAGVQDPRPARPEDIKALVENRLIAVFGGITNPDLNLVGSDKEDALRQIETRLGVTADDVEVSINADGLMDLKMPEAVAKKIVEKTGVEGFSHSFTLTGLSPREVADKVIDILIANEDGTSTPGLLSTHERWESGIQTTGASSNADMSTGGADYVFLGMHSEGTSRLAQNKKNLHKTTLAQVFFDQVQILRNLSIWANKRDDYGMRNHTDVIGNIQVGGDELMVKRHLGPEAARSMYVSMDVRNAILEKLHRRGVTEINGIPVREFFRLFGDYEDKNEWKPGEELLDLNKLTGTIVKASSAKDKNVPDALKYLSRIVSRDGAYVQNEPYWTLPSFASDPMPILFMEKGSGRVIVFNRNKGVLEIHEPSNYESGEMSAAGVKNLIEMVESGKIDDIAISFGTYGAAGVDLRMPSARDKFFEAEFARISTKLVAAKSTGEKKAALLELINLERANLSTQLRTKIAGFLNRGGPLSGELLAFAYDNRLPIGSKFAVNETIRQNPAYPFFIVK